MPYGYVTESNFNRRAFVFHLIKSFSGFTDGTELSSTDFYSLIETICPNFPKQIILDVSQCIKFDPEGDGSDTVHVFRYLSSGVYCCILYEDWLKLVSDFFADESSINSMNALKLKSKLEEFHCTISPSICQPPLAVLQSVMESATPSGASGTSSYLIEVSLDLLRRTLFLSTAVQKEIQKYCR